MINILCVYSLSFHIIEPMNGYTVSKFCLGSKKIQTYAIQAVYSQYMDCDTKRVKNHISYYHLQF
jgi:hypothetical protein